MSVFENMVLSPILYLKGKQLQELDKLYNEELLNL
jgi:hypothetical protein